MNEFKRKQWTRIGLSLIAVIVAVLFLTGVIGGKPMTYQVEEPLTPMLEGITVTMGQNAENSEAEDYLEMDPYLVNIYEGYGFAKDYKAARGHAYTLEDVSKTARPHDQAKCITCKTPDFTKMVNEQGVGVYSLPFDEVMGQMTQAISCYSCHGDDKGNNGQIVITHSYVNEALGENASSIDPKTLNCGQCHIEYYFTPDENETMMPYSSQEEMTPEAILAYYDEMGFKDWEQPGTGTQMLKAQHPEMETFLPSQHAKMGLNCSSCHMAEETAEDGTTYHSHYLVSPLQSETLMATCAACHGSADAARSLVTATQEKVTAREAEVGNRLSELKDTLTAAVTEAKMTEEELDAVRKLHREAQWFFDFCYVENSEGAHNSKLSIRCLDTADERIAEAMALLTGEEPVTEAPAQETGEAGGQLTAAEQGFGGEVTVHLELNEDGTVKSLAIDTPNETAGLGQRASEAEFTEQFVGKAGPFTYGENGVDALSGATVTSNAVLTAINSLTGEGAAAEEKPAEEKPAEETPAEEKTEAEQPAEEKPAETPAKTEASSASAGQVYGSYLSEKETNFSTIRVMIGTKNDEITDCTITSEAKSEGSDFLTDEIKADWAKAIVENQTAETEAITGATLQFSAGAVKEAVADIQQMIAGETTAAPEQAETPAEGPAAEQPEDKPAEEKAAEVPAETPAEEPAEGTPEDTEPEPAAEEQPAEEPAKAEEAPAPAPYGGYVAAKETPFSTIRVIVSTRNGVITDCRIRCDAKEGQTDLVTDENEEAWAKAVAASQGTEVDTVTGATVSSDAVREAVAEILEKIR